jgi:FkbM family methyltransferase
MTPVPARRHFADALHLFQYIWNHPAVRDARVRAIARAVAWQIWERTTGRPWRVRLAPSISLLCYPHSTSAAAVIYCRYPDWPEMLLLLHALREHDIFLDIGANVGVYTLLACSVPGVHVVAFEPSSDVSYRLHENLRINGLDNRCSVVNQAVGRTTGAGYLTRDRGTMNVLVDERHVRPHEALEPVDVVSLDSVVAEATWPAVAVVKIDVEGQELAVLEGAANLLLQARPIVLVEANDPPGLSAFFDRLGFTECSYDPIRRTLTPDTAPAHQANRIYVGDLLSVQERVATPADHRGP